MEAVLRLAAEAAQRRKGESPYETEATAGAEFPRPDEEELHAS